MIGMLNSFVDAFGSVAELVITWLLGLISRLAGQVLSDTANDTVSESASFLGQDPLASVASFINIADQWLPFYSCLSMILGTYVICGIIRIVRHSLGLIPTTNLG